MTSPRVETRATHIAIIDDDGKREIRIPVKSSVYTHDMVVSFACYHGAVASYYVDGVAVSDYSSPRWHDVKGFTDFPIYCPSTAESYGTCEQYLDFARLKTGQTVLDLGGYSGLTAIAFSRAVGAAGRVVVVEPDPANIVACEKNLALYRRCGGADNVTLVRGAVAGGASGTMQFSSEACMGSALTSLVGCGRGGNIVDVPAFTLDELTRRFNVDAVDFIKADIEGAELAVLESSSEFFKRHRPRVILEAHYVNGEVCSEAVTEILTSYGYRCRTVAQPFVRLPLVTAEPAEA